MERMEPFLTSTNFIVWEYTPDPFNGVISLPILSLHRCTAHDQTESGAPGLVQVTPDLCHSLHADFFRSELKGSMNRLNMQRTNLGAYLIEHPEANLAAKLGLTGLFKEEEGEDDGPMPEAPNKAQLADARGELYEELTLLFEAMEERAGEEEGRFVYGVSCNSLSLPSANLHVSWEELVRCAEKAASRAGRER